MAKNKTPTFIHELKLPTTPYVDKILVKRLKIGTYIYNACLAESLKRLDLMRQSKLYQKAIKLPKLIHKKKGKSVKNKARLDYFKEAKDMYHFSEYSIHKYLTKIYSKTWLISHIDSITAQKLASRAFLAVEKYSYGIYGRPRFKSKRNGISSVEGKNNSAGIRFKDGKVIWNTKSKKIELSPIYDFKDKSGLEAYALSCETKYVRLKRKTIKGKKIWYAQLIQEGIAYQKPKNKIRNGIVGLDIGPSSIAIVSDTKAELKPFCNEVENNSQLIAKLQRKLSRSLRNMNPDNFEKDRYEKNNNGKFIKKQGKVIKGKRTWNNSNKYKKLQSEIAELQRKMATTRICSHGRLANTILALGNIIKTEDLSYKSFQKLYGKSVGLRAPGLFVEILKRKALSANGEVIEFNTRTTALSQSCHCGSRKKKSLSERWHICEKCNIKVQRDLYSAFLARFVMGNQLDSSKAKEAFAGAGVLLDEAISNLNKTAIGKSRLASFGLINQSQSGSLHKEESIQDEVLDVVACT